LISSILSFAYTGNIVKNSNTIRNKEEDNYSGNSQTELPQFYYEAGEDIIFVKADKARVARVITNLLTNAFKFTRSGLISVKCRREYQNDETISNHHGNAIINIKDSGSGIAPDIFSRLFAKFATNSMSGTGLGLFICKSIVEAHGGKIWAENNQNETGATFSFSLPIAFANDRLSDKLRTGR
jgi:signal transduction histidine kinase